MPRYTDDSQLPEVTDAMLQQALPAARPEEGTVRRG
jgi:hypothetical protein